MSSQTSGPSAQTKAEEVKNPRNSEWRKKPGDAKQLLRYKSRQVSESF